MIYLSKIQQIHDILSYVLTEHVDLLIDIGYDQRQLDKIHGTIAAFCYMLAHDDNQLVNNVNAILTALLKEKGITEEDIHKVVSKHYNTNDRPHLN